MLQCYANYVILSTVLLRLASYPDLRVILMSASINTNLFIEYFNGCPVIEVKGSVFPVDTYYLEDVIETLNFRLSAEDIQYGYFY